MKNKIISIIISLQFVIFMIICILAIGFIDTNSKKEVITPPKEVEATIPTQTPVPTEATISITPTPTESPIEVSRLKFKGQGSKVFTADISYKSWWVKYNITNGSLSLKISKGNYFEELHDITGINPKYISPYSGPGAYTVEVITDSNPSWEFQIINY